VQTNRGSSRPQSAASANRPGRLLSPVTTHAWKGAAVYIFLSPGSPAVPACRAGPRARPCLGSLPEALCAWLNAVAKPVMWSTCGYPMRFTAPGLAGSWFVNPPARFGPQTSRTSISSNEGASPGHSRARARMLFLLSAANPHWCAMPRPGCAAHESNSCRNLVSCCPKCNRRKGPAPTIFFVGSTASAA